MLWCHGSRQLLSRVALASLRLSCGSKGSDQLVFLVASVLFNFSSVLLAFITGLVHSLTPSPFPCDPLPSLCLPGA